MSTETLVLVLEFVRAEQAGDPFAFRAGTQDYLVRSADGGFESARLAWDGQLLADLDAVRAPGRDPAVVQRLGDTLRRFLGSAGWSDIEAQLLAAVRAQRPVLLTIRSAAAELYALPWELLTLKSSGQFVGELPQVLLRYEWPQTQSATETAARAAGERILLAWSAAAGAVPIAEHLAAIERACQQGGQPFEHESDVLAQVSASRLAAALTAAQQQGRPIAVLHLLCHGSALGTSFGLAFDGEATGAAAVVVDAGRLRQLLAPFAATLHLVVLSVCDSGNAGALGGHLGSVAQTLHRVGIPAVVASRYPLSVTGSIRLTEALYQELLIGLASLEKALLAARVQLAQDAAQLDWASVQLYSRSADGDDSRPLTLRPYRGLLAFLPEHRRFFFGRDSEVDEICRELAALAKAEKPRLLLVAGASGTGKSSVVLAGAVPRLLAASPGLRYATLRPGSNPEAALAQALSSRGDSAAAQLSAPFLLVIDQLEELFTHTEDEARRQSFVQRLWQLASEPTGVSVLMTLRVDFIGRCGELKVDAAGTRLDRIAYDETHCAFVSQMGVAALRAAVERPAQQVGLMLEEGLALRMLADVGGEPGALPLLEDTLDLLWQRRKGRLLTQAAYDELGGVTGALHRRADTLIDSLAAAEQRTARRLLVRLVSLASDVALSTRRRVPLSTLLPSEPQEAARFQRVLGKLVDERLLVRDGEGAAQLVEVAHEALIRKWQRLGEWVQADRQMLAELERVEQWVKQCEELKTLLVDSQIGYAKELQQRYPDDFPPAARKLLLASQAELDRQKYQQKVRQQRTVRLTVSLAAVFALLAWYGYRKAALAAQEAYVARDAARMGASRALSYHPGLRAALLREFEQANLTDVRGWVQGAAEVLRDSAQIQAELPRLPVHHLAHAAIAADCNTVAALTSGAKSVQIWSSGRPAATVSIGTEVAGRGPAIRALALSPEGKTLLVVTGDQVARSYRVDGSAPPAIIAEHVEDIARAAFGTDGKQLYLFDEREQMSVWQADGSGRTSLAPAVSSMTGLPLRNRRYFLAVPESGLIRLWDGSGSRLVLLRGATHLVAVGVCQNEESLATLAADGAMHLWKIGQRPADVGLYALPNTKAVAASFSPDGSRFVLGAEPGGFTELWNSDGSGVPLVLLDSPQPANSIEWSPDGKKVVVAGFSGGATLYSTDHGQILGELSPIAPPPDPSGPTGPAKGNVYDRSISAVSFSPDSQRFATVTRSGFSQVWSAERGQLLATLSSSHGPDRSLHFSSDGKKLVIAAQDHTVRIVDAEGKGSEVVLKFGDIPYFAIRSSTQQILATSNRDPVQLYNLDGSRAAVLSTPILSIFPHLLSTDGNLIVTDQDELRTYKVDEGRLLRSTIPNFHPREHYQLALSRDGSRLLASSGYWEGEARVFAADGRGEPLQLRGQAEALDHVAMSPSGNLAITVGRKGSAWLWYLDKVAALEPEALRQALWEAYPGCASGPQVEDFMNRPDAIARWDTDTCTRMVQCLHDGSSLKNTPPSGARYQQCLARFRSDQHSWLRDSAIRAQLTGMLP